eukprot:TRINITY_DN22318_c0_g1_i1.p1 TRINITY_DN22318_c0_g1~~TRINITY_DN22318_c0_g1_i1.p1  ORF type:complete len:1340 (+),score=259.46 TRINITY_DN22318_c0_g1_i1:107-4126(+)
MDFLLVEAEGFDKDCILSIRCGGIRRQSVLALKRPIGFPAQLEKEVPVKFDVYRPVGSIELSVKQEDGRIVVRFPTTPGSQSMALNFQVTRNGSDFPSYEWPCSTSEFGSRPGTSMTVGNQFDYGSRPGTSMTTGNQFSLASAPALHTPSYGSRPGTSMTTARLSPAQELSGSRPGTVNSASGFGGRTMIRHMKQNTAIAAAQSYLDRFSLLGKLQGMLSRLLGAQPDDPWSFLVKEISRQQEGALAVDSAAGNMLSPAQGKQETYSIPEGPPQPVASTENKDDQCKGTKREWTWESTRQYLEVLQRAASVRATIKSRIDSLQAQNKRLEDEAEKLRQQLKDLGHEAPSDDGVQPDSSSVNAAAALAWMPESSNAATRQLVERLGQVMAEHEKRCFAVTGLASSLSQAVLGTATDVSQMQKELTILRAQLDAHQEASSLSKNRAAFQSVTTLLDEAKSPPNELVDELLDSPSAIMDDHESSDEEEQEMLAKTWQEDRVRKRGRAVSAEAYGAWNNRRAAFVPPVCAKTDAQTHDCCQTFLKSPLFSHIDMDVITTVVKAMPLEKYEPGSQILKQGQDGDSLYILLEGKVDLYDDRSGHKYITTFKKGRTFGELAMLYSVPRALTVEASPDTPCVLARLQRSVYQNLIVRYQMQSRERSEECLTKVRLLETLNPHQVACLCDVLEMRTYNAGDAIVKQGDVGDEFFIVLSGECAATITTSSINGEEADVQEHRRYQAGGLFGEQALLKNTTRAATVTALQETEVLCLSRARFERMLGPLSIIQRQNYKDDPRKSISDFYKSGDKTGPAGSCLLRNPRWHPRQVKPSEKTSWFAVYRPTSRDAIAKMLSGVAVGKGLNVKGKSAKRGRQSGFVPFIQICSNADKEMLAKPKLDARIKIFFSSEAERERMLKVFESHLDPVTGVKIVGDRVIFYVDLYPGTPGLDIPETVLREVYIHRADLNFRAGWETGRTSEPAFMDMNFKSLREDTEPKIVLFQADKEDSLNPHGLLVAYAEKTVKPVVSDFDTFIVGNKGLLHDKLSPVQVDLETWAVDQIEDILNNPGPASWTSRWLDCMKKASEKGMYPNIPPYGFGDSTSYRFISEAIQATKETGAVRHGAECFNFYFPQELDEEYLVVWDGFGGQSTEQAGSVRRRSSMGRHSRRSVAGGENTGCGWEYFDEDELRLFLVDRVREGYTFPINPIWPIRDAGWIEVFEALASTEDGKQCLELYFPANSGICDRIRSLKAQFPDGFQKVYNHGRTDTIRKSMQLDLDPDQRAALLLGSLKAPDEQCEDEDDDDGDDDAAEEKDQQQVESQPEQARKSVRFSVAAEPSSDEDASDSD